MAKKRKAKKKSKKKALKKAKAKSRRKNPVVPSEAKKVSGDKDEQILGMDSEPLDDADDDFGIPEEFDDGDFGSGGF